VPIGYLVNVAVMASCTWLALAPPHPRQSSPLRISFMFGYLLNELPFVAFYFLLASTLLAFGQGDIDSPGSWVAVGLAVLTAVGLGVVAWRGLRAGRAVDHALSEGLGAGWRTAIDAGMAARLRRRLPFSRILFAPFFVRRRDVERIKNIRYGDAGERNRLDVYRHRSRPSASPTLVYLHGGAFRIGSKNHGARPLIYRLASQGWVCISANYRLSPRARFPDHLIDVKKVLAWVREYGHEYGADPAVVFVAGSSAGGHLASLAALTPNDPAFQPGFEHADTSVTAAISLYGYYGPLDTSGRPPSSPLAYVGTEAAPFFVAHGDRDTVVIVEDARLFVELLRRTSSYPVVYVELPGAQHAFDFFHSLRFETLVEVRDARP
jgi:acetyl esterase/lipase